MGKQKQNTISKEAIRVYNFYKKAGKIACQLQNKGQWKGLCKTCIGDCHIPDYLYDQVMDIMVKRGLI